MPTKDEKILAIMEKELAKDPGVATSDLFDKAKAVDSGVSKLSLRQFHAKYPLQIKRKTGKGRRAKRKVRVATARRTRGRAKGGREGIRDVFLRFAEDLTGAEERRDLVKILANVDGYVDDAVKAARK